MGEQARKVDKAQAERWLTDNLPDVLKGFGIDVFNECGISCNMEVRIKD